MSKKVSEGFFTDIEKYLFNIERFYKNNIYIESDSNITKKSNIDKSIVKTSSSPEIINFKSSIIEVDLFGNESFIKEKWENSETLDELCNNICTCQKCPLGKTRTNFVFGTGNPNADILLIGEAPGADEDLQGEPFVGKAGQLLNKILDAAGFKREDVYICNILKCRPPNNRNPLPEEVELCRPYLEKQIKLVNPKFILLLGKVAAESLLKTKEPLIKLRGKIHNYKGWNVLITFHPAALLRNPNWKKPAWDDFLYLKNLYLKNFKSSET
jgi:DNA polymerase